MILVVILYDIHTSFFAVYIFAVGTQIGKGHACKGEMKQNIHACMINNFVNILIQVYCVEKLYRDITNRTLGMI